MHVLIDAWLERESPRVRLLDQASGITLLELGGDLLKSLFDSGEITLQDLDDPDHCLLNIGMDCFGDVRF